MEFDEHEEEEMEDEEEEAAATVQQSFRPVGKAPTRYRECLKNHALSVGGHAVDGCGEFMAAGEEGTIDSLRCAACNCHRNFHRKETDNRPTHSSPQVSSYYRSPPPAGYLHLNPHRPVYSQEGEDVSNPSSSGGRKRFRTKFTAEQKEKMLQFADEVGWRIRREEEEAVERFCAEAGVSRHVLKVWMHNNKNSRSGGKKP